jgi:hypothetical protein
MSYHSQSAEYRERSVPIDTVGDELRRAREDYGIGIDLVSQRIRDAASQAIPAKSPFARAGVGSLKDAVETLEAEIISQGLIRTHWNKSQLAKELGISRSNLTASIGRTWTRPHYPPASPAAGTNRRASRGLRPRALGRRTDSTPPSRAPGALAICLDGCTLARRHGE